MLLLISALLIVFINCSGPGPKEIETIVEKWMKIDIPSDFKVLKSDYSFAIGDDLTTIDIEYPLLSYKRFLSKIDTLKWTKVQFGYQLILSEKYTNSGYDFFHVSISPSKDRILHIQYGNE